MKKNYLHTLLLCIIASWSSFSQTTLTAGDLVVIQFQADTPDTFRFVPLVDLEQGTIIKFSEGGYSDNSSQINTNESIIVYTAPTTISAGTNIKFEADDITNNPSVWAFELGTFVGFSTSGDQLLVYQGDTATPTFIFAVASNSTEWQTNYDTDSNQTALPPGLTNGVNAVAAGAGSGAETEYDNIYYNGTTTGTKAELLASVANVANWLGINTTSYTPITTDFTITTTSVPSLAITSPANNTTLSATTSVDVSLSISNFTISGDAGAGVSDNSGDGYLKATLEETGQQTQTTYFFSATPDPITTVPGRTYTATLELVDNSGNSLNPKVEASVTFSVELPCDIQLGTITEVCDAVTTAVDTYTTTIPFTVGNTATYTITAKDDSNNDVGTIGGDDPSSTETGNIIISGVPEGTNFTVKVIGGTGSSCDLTRNISSPTCISLPIYEPFDYTTNTDLIAQPLWQDASTSSTPNNIQIVVNDDGVGNPVLGSYYGVNELPAFMGNMVTLSGGGSDPYIGFSDVSTGSIFVSFTFHVTDMSSFSDVDGGYFAVLAEDSSFRQRLWLKDTNPGEGLTYHLGLSTISGSVSDIHTGFTANLAEPVFVVIAYDFDNGEQKLWVVPDSATFGTNTPPAANLTMTSGTASKINRFLLRQDSSSETPSIDFDELRIGTSWKDVTSNPTASTRNTEIEGFVVYPNPVSNGKLNIRTNSTDKKQVAIYNVLGKNVLNTRVSGLNAELNVSAISSGIYILKVVEGTKTSTSKLVIR